MMPIHGFPHPALIFDKSAFQSLSMDEHAQHAFRYREATTPVLLREILGDLAKERHVPFSSPEEAVKALARKFHGSGGVLIAEYRKLCALELLGHTRIKGDGRPIIDQFVTSADGDEMLIDVTPEQHAMMRWARATFSEHERRVAAGQREQAASFTITSLQGRLRQHQVLIPRPRDVADLATVAGRIMATTSLQAALIDWLTEQLGFTPSLRDAVLTRWQGEARPSLAHFAPYAFHCARTFMLLLVGMKHGILSARPTNRIDIEYLFYVPFCEVFVSQDRLHTQLAPFVLRPGQRFVPLAEFKAEMRRLADERRSRRSSTDPR